MLPRKLSYLIVSLTAYSFLIVGCGPGGDLCVRLDPEVKRPRSGVVLFICDGLSLDFMRHGCDAGWLPNIQRRFIAAGTRVENAVTGVPSITYAILTSYATGLGPAQHGVIANEWFDRGLRLWREYNDIEHYRDVNSDFSAPTIYELIKPRVSLSIQNAVHRGVTRNIANWAQSGVRWFFHDYTAVDKLSATTFDPAANWANQNDVWPDLLICYFPGLDSVGHRRGVHSQPYRLAAEHLDYQIGRVCDWLEAEDLLDSTTLILVADHGMVPVQPGNQTNLLKILRDEMGRKATQAPCQHSFFETRYLHFEHYDTVLAVSASRFAAVHFRGKLSWSDYLPPTQLRDLLENPPAGRPLWDRPGIDLAAFLSDPNQVELRSPNGSARIEQRPGTHGPQYRYIPVPDDVFGYLRDDQLAKFVAAGFHDSRQWLNATIGQAYPDIVPHLLPLLHHPHTGDLVLFAAPGYSFGNELSGHGGINRDEMRIPMIFAGPGIEHGGTIYVARAVDLVPTMINLLGCEPQDTSNFDGVALFPLSERIEPLTPAEQP